MATKEQIRRIYGMAAALGIKGSGKDDLLHEMVYGLTGKTSIKELTDKDVQSVMGELVHRMRFAEAPIKSKKPKKQEADNEEIGNYGMATKEQQRLCWRYCYRLKELDTKPNPTDVGDRMVGAIRKICSTNIVSKEDPFRCVTQEEAAKLIEQLKRYVNTAERRAKGVVSLSEVKIKYEELSDEQKSLVDCIGAEAFIKLVTCYGGTTLYVPKADSLARSDRDEKIRSEFDGYNYRELCRKYKLSERTIRSITAEKNNRLRSAPLAGQITIEGLEDLKNDC